ncbi:GPW/gp25 family protein [Moraxella haemolytica]|uniref:GPW/gp25 family protein n=1 Tax=Moraxella TaxID=475 RepID=UPI0025434827|nr:GPW/gp25 family protein [Moraxella sp. ZY171148]WII94702.1 GPW/gp25 family protein [Moraxella sp. ZY171148]
MISKDNGKVISYINQIRQSIGDILTTPIGSRVMRREYGSLLPELIDRPIDDVLILQCYSAIYSAILRWENRVIIESISIGQIDQGVLEVQLYAHFNELGGDGVLDVSLRF